MQDLILASGSSIRQKLLANVGLSFSVETAPIDERAVEADLRQAMNTIEIPRLTEALAMAKASAVSLIYPHALVIGADQILDLDSEVLHKAPTPEAAFEKLTRLQGRTHRLTSAAALIRNDEVLWAGSMSATLTMRTLSEAECAAYVETAGDAATASVGAYRLEELGPNLFEQIEGDYFTILGLPLLLLLEALRTHRIDPLAP
ncbi:MAG: Maf family nucleotide pyrophosphatase [Pseudomonadota bacterium]